MVGWWDGGMVGWGDGGMVGWWDGGMVGWWDGGMEEWRNGGMEEWRNGGMEEWREEKRRATTNRRISMQRRQSHRSITRFAQPGRSGQRHGSRTIDGNLQLFPTPFLFGFPLRPTVVEFRGSWEYRPLPDVKISRGSDRKKAHGAQKARHLFHNTQSSRSHGHGFTSSHGSKQQAARGGVTLAVTLPLETLDRGNKARAQRHPCCHGTSQ